MYDDSAAGFRPQDSMYFAMLAGEMATWFHSCGLAGEEEIWPEGSQPGMPLSEWKRFYKETIQDPIRSGVYARREFFDVWALVGDRSILWKLNEDVLRELGENPVAVTLLANDTLAHLPVFTFFEGLVLDLDGERRDSFDIATAAIWPIADAARVFALASRRLAPANTLQRLEAAAQDFPRGAAILRDAAEAFRVALYYQTLAGGSRIEPCALGKFDQRLLKTMFSSIERLLEFTAATFEPAV
jgi:signal-transduction protein with cAMP-binding, CBS, and nucleotidyltransferase domain